ncbi:MAG TPA: glycosyltransferase family 4 protein [Vicinamibacteria bacterium]|nr:glycosyltransferase family 4 protein [Vicinamibacteria bacterium]
MNLCFVIQRYGLEVAGGAERHCRWLAERLARSHQVSVETTCALDYITWKNHYPSGRDLVGGIPVTRHPVQKARSERHFALISDLVFHEPHAPEDEERWVRENGPRSPLLLRALETRRDVDLFLFYCYRYYPSFFGLPLVRDRAVLVPTAEEDPAVRLPVFGPLFRSPRGILYLTPEEQELVQGVSGNAAVPSVVVGSGVEIPPGFEAIDVRSRFSLPEKYLLYVGRIDRNKGVDHLVHHYLELLREREDTPPLVLAGKPVLEIHDPRIRVLGVVSEEEKFALLAGCEVLLMPSAYESLSIIVLEAWAIGRPVLANAACRVLEGQCQRSGGGLYYRGYREFAETLSRLLDDPSLRDALGRSGRAYVSAEYEWEAVERRTVGFLESLAKTPRS